MTFDYNINKAETLLSRLTIYVLLLQILYI
jgi:hypothetical protein